MVVDVGAPLGEKFLVEGEQFLTAQGDGLFRIPILLRVQKGQQPSDSAGGRAATGI